MWPDGHAADPAMSDCAKVDWAGSRLALAAVWGVPAAAMLLALLLEPGLRAAVWIAMLVWMGVACVANARRCGRTHCHYTGPFFLGMAGLVAAYAAGLLPLGSQPWLLLGSLIVVGNALIWWGMERLFGTYLDTRSPRRAAARLRQFNGQSPLDSPGPNPISPPSKAIAVPGVRGLGVIKRPPWTREF